MIPLVQNFGYDVDKQEQIEKFLEDYDMKFKFHEGQVYILCCLDIDNECLQELHDNYSIRLVLGNFNIYYRPAGNNMSISHHPTAGMLLGLTVFILLLYQILISLSPIPYRN